MKIASGEHVREIRIEGESRSPRRRGDRLPRRRGRSGRESSSRSTDGATGSSPRGAETGSSSGATARVYEFAAARPGAAGTWRTRATLLAPMPGRIRKTFVSEGQTVRKGDVLLLLEAMKMEHAIRAPRDGSVRRLPHREGELVETGTALVELG